MKKKQPKQVNYVVIIRDHEAGPKSVHSFRDKYQAKEFFDKMKFALDILNDDWYYITMEEVEV